MKRNRPYYSIDQSALYRLTTRRKLAILLGVSLNELEKLANATDRYDEWDEPKRNGGTRRIENPRSRLKRVQAHLASLLSRIHPPDYLFCPVRGRSYITNAHNHAGHEEVRKLDIKRYFEATTDKRVYWFFNKIMECSTDVASILTKIATLRGHLPTGSPLSPILSHYAHQDMWNDIAVLAQSIGAFSVYMDDLTLSGSQVPGEIMWAIRRRIRKAGLDYHKEKAYHRGRAVVTGVATREGRLRLPHAQHEKAHRLKIQLSSTIDPEEKKKLQIRLRGIQAQASQVERAN